jgi:sulfur relay protein TusB/DsrH
MKLIVINMNDRNALNQALNVEADVLLIQEAVLFLNKGRSDVPDFSGKKVYALGIDVEKRGLSNRLVEGVELVDYNNMVDLMFSSDSVVNL